MKRGDSEHYRKKGKLLITGNRKTGKTALFLKLISAGTKKDDSETKKCTGVTGTIRRNGQILLDTTGLCSILSPDAVEKNTRNNIIREYLDDAISGIFFVADARNMSRSLALALQFAGFGLPMILAVNRVDEARRLGIDIDWDALAELLGMTVLPLDRETNTTDTLIEIMAQVADQPPPNRRQVSFPQPIEEFFGILGKLVKDELFCPRLLGLFLLSDDHDIHRLLSAYLGEDLGARLEGLAAACLRECATPFDILFERVFHQKAKQIMNRCQRTRTSVTSSHRRTAAGDFCTRPLTGLPIAFFTIGLLYFFVGSFGAGILADAIHHHLFEGAVMPWITRLASFIPNIFFREMLVNPDFGIIPNGIGLAVCLVLPVIFCFHLAFGVMEDSGYLSRLSVLLDHALQKIGLNGKGVVPLALGFSCVTSAILTTRMLNSEKEKNIAAFLLFMGFPCAPLIAVMFVILGNMPASAAITMFGLIAVQILGLGFLANRMLPGRRMPLLMEMPPMRTPRPGQILGRAFRKTSAFMREAVPVFIMASFCIFLFDWTGGLRKLEHFAAPFLESLMGLPETSMQVFIKTMIRRESGAAELAHLSGSYDNLQLVVNLLVMILIAPCINASIVLFKERGTRTAMVIVGAVTIYAIVAGSVVNHTCRFLGITFT